jgi:hypothetical protein
VEVCGREVLYLVLTHAVQFSKIVFKIGCVVFEQKYKRTILRAQFSSVETRQPDSEIIALLAMSTGYILLKTDTFNRQVVSSTSDPVSLT